MNNHWGPLPDCYCCFHTSHTSSLSASQIPPSPPTSSTSSCTSLTTISPHQTFPLPWIPEALCVPPSTPFTRLGGKQGLGLAPRQVVVHTGWVWRRDWQRPHQGETLTRINASSHPSNILRSQNTVWVEANTDISSCTFYCSVHRYI